MGVFLNEEIGPAIKGEYIGWVSSESASTSSFPSHLHEEIEETKLRMRMLSMRMPGQASRAFALEPQGGARRMNVYVFDAICMIILSMKAEQLHKRANLPSKVFLWANR